MVSYYIGVLSKYANKCRGLEKGEVWNRQSLIVFFISIQNLCFLPYFMSRLALHWLMKIAQPYVHARMEQFFVLHIVAMKMPDVVCEMASETATANLDSKEMGKIAIEVNELDYSI